MAHNNYVVGIIGPKGSGKTALMAYLLYKDYLTGRSVVSNFDLSFEHKQKEFKELAKLPDFLQDATVGYDEFHIAVDSRRTSSKKNIDFDIFLSQLRKLGCILYYTTQIFDKLDVRVRNQTDLLIFPVDEVDGVFTYIVKDRWTAETVKVLELNMNPIFEAGIYNTNQRILFSKEEETENE